MQAIHTALNYTVNTRTTAVASSGRHLCNRDTCPDCSHLFVAAVRLMESVRERLVASWNKAVASAVSTSQHPKQSVTLTSTPAILVTLAVGKSWRITEKAPPPQPSKRASFFKGTLEQRDRQHRSCTETCVGRKVRRLWPFRETWGTAGNLQLADDQTRKNCTGTVIES